MGNPVTKGSNVAPGGGLSLCTGKSDFQSLAQSVLRNFNVTVKFMFFVFVFFVFFWTSPTRLKLKNKRYLIPHRTCLIEDYFSIHKSSSSVVFSR